jgi:hypothetical protein
MEEYFSEKKKWEVFRNCFLSFWRIFSDSALWIQWDYCALTTTINLNCGDFNCDKLTTTREQNDQLVIIFYWNFMPRIKIFMVLQNVFLCEILWNYVVTTKNVVFFREYYYLFSCWTQIVNQFPIWQYFLWNIQFLTIKLAKKIFCETSKLFEFKIQKM